MPIRLTAEHRDVSGAARKIDIYDRDLPEYLGSTMLCTSDFYVLKHEGDVNDPFKRIIPCNCQFTLFLQHPNYTEDQLYEVNQFFSDLIDSHEGRFYVRCAYGEGLDTQYEFYGKILPDIGELTLDFWQTVQITAIDGISGLRDVEYRPTGYTDLTPDYAIQTIKFKDHFTDIISRNDVVEYFQDEIAAFNTSMFTTSAFWTESKSEAGDIFNQVRLRNIYFEQVGKTYRKYQSCYDVLEDLLIGFVARCVYASGKYHIEQLPYQDNATLIRYGYKYNGDAQTSGSGIYGTKETLNYTTDDNVRALVYPTKRWLTPLKAIELTHSKTFTNYMNGMAISIPGNIGPHNFGNVIATGARLVIQWKFEFTNVPTLDPNTYLFIKARLRMIVKIGDLYLNFPDGVCEVKVNSTGEYFVLISDNTVPIMEWSVDPVEITLGFTVANSLNFTTVENFTQQLTNSFFIIETLEIQEDGEMIFEFLDFKIYNWINGLPEITTDPDITLTLKPSSRIILASGYSDLFEQPKAIKRYEVGDIRNTSIYKINLAYFDSALLTFQQLFIKNSIYVTTDEPTTEWTDPDAALTLPIQDLMMKTMLAMRQYPAEVFKMEFFFLTPDIFRMDKRVAIDGQLYIPLDLEIFSGTGIYRVSLLKVYKDFTGINIIDIDEPEPDTQYPVPDGSLDANYPAQNGIQIYEEWENVSLNYVEVENLSAYVNVNDDYLMKTKFHVIVNGVRQRYVSGTAPTPNIQNREFDVDTSTDRIYIGKGSGNIKHVELLVYY